jgi:uncharacterized protein (DUF1778 family)
MKRERQVSAYVSDATNDRLDMFVQETGVKKARAIEDAIASYLDAYDELPESAIIPTRIVLTQEGWDRFVELLEAPPNPTEGLVRLMRDHK